MAFTSYGDNITVDKASAPGAKPRYSQVIGEGIFYEDHRLCMLNVPVKVGKPVTVEFERTHRDPAQVCEIGFANIYDVDSYVLTVELPPVLAQKLTLTPVNFPEDAEITKSTNPDGSVVYKYKLKNIKSVKEEEYAPSTSVSQPHIFITGHFDGVKGLYGYLSSFVANEVPSSDVVSLASQLTSGLTEPLDKIDAIATWVRQNIRYVAIEHGEDIGLKLRLMC